LGYIPYEYIIKIDLMKRGCDLDPHGSGVQQLGLVKTEKDLEVA
jgi:hypothetical protein